MLILSLPRQQRVCPSCFLFRQCVEFAVVLSHAYDGLDLFFHEVFKHFVVVALVSSSDNPYDRSRLTFERIPGCVHIGRFRVIDIKHSSYAALINKKAVCQGYASLFYRLALEAGIDARVISGDSNGPHAWNIVKIEGSYYNLDSTWDAGNTEYEYFLKNAKDFPNHTRDAAYTTAAFTSSYPIAATSYAVHGSIQDYAYKITNNGQVIITKYTGTDADVTTPDTIDGMPVIGIDTNAFFDLPNLETLTISEGVQSVSDTFTGNVPKLRQIHFPSTLDFRTPDGSNYPILGSCPSLEEITVPDNSPYLYAENGILYDSAQYAVLCSAQNADLGDLVLPETVQIINTVNDGRTKAFGSLG